MPKMTFIERDGTRKEVDASNGLSVLEIAHRHGVDIEGACEGSLACSTCHVIVEPDWYELLKTATEDEEDMLDLAFGLTQTSRLGCQIIMSEELDGLTVSAADWWFNLRPSNTEPLLRLNVEADSETAMAALRDEVLAMVRPTQASKDT